jgi:hypothetical protein
MIQGSTITQLGNFEINVDGETWVKLFTRAGANADLATHLWEKFHQHHHSLLSLWFNLDPSNQRRMVTVVNTWMKEYSANHVYSGMM